MERLAMEELIKWKNNPKRKPLVVMGARQVGKTWLMKEFGNRERYILLVCADLPQLDGYPMKKEYEKRNRRFTGDFFMS